MKNGINPLSVILSGACTERSRMCRNVILSVVEGSEILRFRCATLRMTTDNSSLTQHNYRVNRQSIVLRHCGLDPQSPEYKEILKQVQDDVVVTFHIGPNATTKTLLPCL